MIRFEACLRRTTECDPDRIALVSHGRRTRYAELHELVEQFAASLVLTQEFERGQRCILFLDNCLENAVGIFGTLRAGGVFSVINPGTKAEKLAWLLNDCEATILVTQAALLPVARRAAAGVPSLRRIIVVDGATDADTLAWTEFMAAAPSLLPDTPRGIDIDLAMLVYTSGSTGHPKGVMMTHRNMLFAATSVSGYLEMCSEDVILSVLPLSFDYGLYQWLMCVLTGATLVLERSFAFPQKILPLLASEKVTGFPVVPTMAALIVQLRNFNPEWSASVRFLTNTAAALPPAHILRLQALFPQTQIYSMYGMTESKRCTYLPPEQLSSRPDSVGIAIPGTEVWVADESGVALPPDTIGELVVRGGHVMQGYWRNEEATAKALRTGRYPWEKVLYTGDLFRMDEQGYCYFVGRKDDIIKSRGEKISPREVENVLYALAGVREAAVVGVPDEILGQSVKAIVALADDAKLTARDVIAHCLAHLEDFMVPRQIEFREVLPRTATGKIRRSALQAEAEGRPFADDERDADES